MTELEQKKWMVESDKLQAETQKLLAEHIHFEKKNKWFEFSLMLAMIVATIALTKLFL
jgi:hypothetical protein